MEHYTGAGSVAHGAHVGPNVLCPPCVCMTATPQSHCTCHTVPWCACPSQHTEYVMRMQPRFQSPPRKTCFSAGGPHNGDIHSTCYMYFPANALAQYINLHVICTATRMLQAGRPHRVPLGLPTGAPAAPGPCAAVGRRRRRLRRQSAFQGSVPLAGKQQRHAARRSVGPGLQSEPKRSRPRPSALLRLPCVLQCYTMLLCLHVLTLVPSVRSGQDGNTPLHWACMHGNADAVRFLLASFANVGARSHVGTRGGGVPVNPGHASHAMHARRTMNALNAPPRLLQWLSLPISIMTMTPCIHDHLDHHDPSSPSQSSP